MVNGSAEKEEMSIEHEASIACQELQAAKLASKVVVLLPLVMAGVVLPARMLPSRAQGLVGMLLPLIELNWAGEAVERYDRHVSRALSKTLGCQTEEL